MTIILACGLRSTKSPVSDLPLQCRSQSLPATFILLSQRKPRNYPHKAFPRFSSSITATRVNHHPLVNPPCNTLPAPLVLPSRSSSQSAPSYYFSLGRAYLSFYKTGLKAVYGNYKASRALRARLPSSTTPETALERGLLSRGEWLLLLRSRHDVAKIPLFALVFMICGEFTPLVVIFLGGVVPRTCVVPKQVVSAREKAEERRGRSFREGTIQSQKAPSIIQELRTGEILHIGRSLGLYSALWDRVGKVPVGIVKGRVVKRAKYLDLDDMAIERDGGVGQMEMEEVRIAMDERGLDVLGKNDAHLRSVLRSWLHARKEQPVTKLLLTRPSIWAKDE